MAQAEQNSASAPGIRGPELHRPELIAASIAGQSSAALSSYAMGILAVIRVWRLLAAARRLETLRAERAFLVSQLATLETRDPRAVALALAGQERAASPAAPAREPDQLDALHDLLKSTEADLRANGVQHEQLDLCS